MFSARYFRFTIIDTHRNAVRQRSTQIVFAKCYSVRANQALALCVYLLPTFWPPFHMSQSVCLCVCICTGTS